MLSILHNDIPAGKISFNALLALSLGIHIIFLGAALLFRSYTPALPHLQSITVDIKNIDLPAKTVKPDIKEQPTAQPATVQKMRALAGSSSPAAPLQKTEVQPLAQKEEMPLLVQAKPAVSAPPAATTARLPTVVQQKEPAQQTAAAAGRAAPVAPQPHAIGKEYTSRVRALIDQQKEYPLMARKSGTEGTVYIKFVLARDGRLKQAEVSRSSGRRILDKAAIEAVTRVNRFPAVPDDVVDSELNFELPLAFKIAGN